MFKNFSFIIFILFFFLTTSCNDIPIAGDICELTTQICYYANKICEMLPQEKQTLLDDDEIKTEIYYTANNIQSLYASLYILSKNYNKETRNIYRTELTKIRDNLHEIYIRDSLVNR